MWYFYMIDCIGIWKYNLGKRIIYTGETSRDPETRFDEHVRGIHSDFMKNNGWRPCRPVYFECMPDCDSRYIALLREKQLKHSKEERRYSNEAM